MLISSVFHVEDGTSDRVNMNLGTQWYLLHVYGVRTVQYSLNLSYPSFITIRFSNQERWVDGLYTHLLRNQLSSGSQKFNGGRKFKNYLGVCSTSTLFGRDTTHGKDLRTGCL